MKPFFPTRVAEIIFAIIFAYFGYLHFKNAAAMGGAVPSYLPGDGKIWIYLTGAAFIFAAVAIIANFHRTLGCYLLAFVLIVFVITVHLKNFETNPSGTLKDLAMAMAAIIIGNRGKK
jgi:putative oxidoreductase